MALVPGARQKLKRGLFARASPEEAAPQPLPAGAAPAGRREDVALVRDFDALLERYQKPIYGLIFQWAGDHEEAADLTQETFLSAYKAREQFRGESNAHTWLRAIAHNHFKNRVKQRSRQREMEGPSLDAPLPTEGDEEIAGRDVADWTLSPSLLLEQKELRALIDRAVNGLAPEYKVVLTLRVVEGLAYDEIAQVTGLTLEAVKTRLNRARAMVRQKVEPYYRI